MPISDIQRIKGKRVYNVAKLLEYRNVDFLGTIPALPIPGNSEFAGYDVAKSVKMSEFDDVPALPNCLNIEMLIF